MTRRTRRTTGSHIAKSALSLHEPFELDGEWWIAGTEPRFVGRLRLEPRERLVLEVLGHYPNVDNFRITNDPNVLGMTADGRQVTLNHPHSSIANISFPGMAKSQSQAFLAFIGSHYEADEPRYLFARAEYSNLEEWLGLSGITVEIGRDPAAETVIRHRMPEPIEFDIPSEQMRLKFAVDSNIQPGFAEASLRHTAFVEFRPETPQPWSWYAERLRRFRLFLALMMDDLVVHTRIRGATSRTELAPGRFDTEYDDVIHTWERRPPPRDKHPGFMLLTARGMAADFQAVVQRWFERFDILAPLVDLLWTVRASKQLVLEFRLLALTQGLEGYHRLSFGGGYQTEAEWTTHRDVLLAAIPAALAPEHREALKGRIRYGHEYSQRTRLRQLLRRMDEREREFVTRDLEAFVHGVVDARNGTTHQGSGPGTAGWPQIAEWTRRLDVMALVTILKDLGFASDIIVAALERTGRRRAE